VPSWTLLGQSVVSGVLIGGLYGLLALGLSLSWGLLRLINIAYFAFAFLAAYLVFHLGTRYHVAPWYAVLLIVPPFFALGVALHWLFERFRVTGLVTLLVTFGIIVLVETLIHWVWTADFQRYELEYGTVSLRIGKLFVPLLDLLACAAAVAIALASWAVLRWSYFGKALRAAAEDPAIAGAFGINYRAQAYLLAGVCAALAAIAGVFIALISTLAPAQIFAWFGVVFAVVIIGGLGNPIGALLAGLLIGITESITMAIITPAWAPVVAFSLLIALLIWQPRWL
jgi:branched-chain amino acid transport system permease protein